MATLKEQFAARQAQSQNAVNNQYDTTLNAQKQSLADAYNRNMSVQDQTAADTRRLYDNANRSIGQQAAITQRSMDQFADVRNLNRQPGSQQALSLNLAAQRAAGAAAAQQNMAMAEMERQRELAKTTYNNQVQQAIADNDYRRAAALLDDYNNQNTWLEKNAANLANYGDFSGYENLYGWDTANQMKWMWVAQNPEVAYNTGMITAEQYKYRTGKWPAGYTPPNAGGGYGLPGLYNDDGTPKAGADQPKRILHGGGSGLSGRK